MGEGLDLQKLIDGLLKYAESKVPAGPLQFLAVSALETVRTLIDQAGIPAAKKWLQDNDFLPRD